MGRRPGWRNAAGRRGPLLRRRRAPVDGADDAAVRRLFDAEHYAAQRATPVAGDGLEHYLRTGWRLGYDPHPLFATAWYLAREVDVAAAGVCPLVHFARHGAFELRHPHPLFDPPSYCARASDPWDRRANPLVHYLDTGGRDGRCPHRWFDDGWYRAANPDVDAAGGNALVHYVRHGWREGRNPHPDFDVRGYLAANPDVAAAGIEPLTHYALYGRRQGRDPSPRVPASSVDRCGPCAPVPERHDPEMASRAGPSIAVVIATTPAAPGLDAVLVSLEAQTLDCEAYELIVIVDGADGVGWTGDGLRRTFGAPAAGRAAALNLGLFLSTAPLVLFLADDEVAAPDLLTQHLAAHRHHPELEAAVVGRSSWSSELALQPLPAWLSALDRMPFVYPANPCGQVADDMFFRVRQLSVTRALLTRRGVFDPSFERLPDVELALRLRQHGLAVRHWCPARSTRVTAPGVDELARELTAAGPELVRLADLDERGLVGGLCRVDTAAAAWRRASPGFAQALSDVLVTAADPGAADDAGAGRAARDVLVACRDRGIALAQGVSPIAGADPPAIDAGLSSPPTARGRVLVVGVVLADRPNTAASTSAELARTSHHVVDQRWVVVGRPPRRVRSSPSVAPELVADVRRALAPKYEILGELLATSPLTTYEHVLLVDDDVVLPAGFLDAFLDTQRHVGFALAQPARALGSPADHPIVLRHPGLRARRTLFVEQGPLLSIHRSVLDAVVPFDLRSPMGWGYECVWSHRIADRSPIGIIDATPVDHSLRPTATFYSKVTGAAQSAALLGAVAHRPLDDCMRVLDVYP